jgi:dihydroxyacetone kinase
MRAAEQELNAADSALGDGDTGQTMRRVAEKVEAAATDDVEDLGVLFRSMGMAATSATGSSLGTLCAVGLLAVGKSLKGQSEVPVSDIGAMLKTAEEALQARGGAALGDKTVLDSIHALAESLSSDEASAEVALKAAKQALDTFRDKPCRIGRARMYAEKSVGEDDPGMLAFLRLVAAVAAPADNN